MEARTNNPGVSQSAVAQNRLLVCGVIGPPLFVLVFLVDGATRRGYSPWRNFVSQLGTGERAWVQITNFIVCGSLVILFAVGLRQALRPGRSSVGGPILMGAFGLGLIVAGVFPTDPALGYPPGAQQGAQTVHGTIHGFNGIFTFGVLAASCFVLARRFAEDPNWKGWAAYSIITGALIVAGFIAAGATSSLDESGTLPNAPTGLIQRVVIVAGWAWITLLAARLLREPPPTSR